MWPKSCCLFEERNLMRPKDRVKNVVSGNAVDRTPVVPILGAYSSKLTGISVREGLEDANKQYEAQKRAIETFGYDGSFTWMDLTAEAEALGLKRSRPENDLPAILEHPLKTKEDLNKLNIPRIEDTRLQVFVETCEKLSDNLGKNHFISSYVVGPYTLVGLLMDVEKLLMSCLKDQNFVHESLEFVVSYIKEYIDRLSCTGVDAITVLEPTASGSLISPKIFREFASPSLRDINRYVSQKNMIPILHICGNTNPILKDMAETETRALSIGSKVDLKNARGLTTIIGNIDPSTTMVEKKREEIKSLAIKCIEDMKGGDFILSTGCDIALGTPQENIKALVDAVR
jgi:uroporphyrinogen decarboxylase